MAAAIIATPDEQVKHFVTRTGLGPLRGPEDFKAAADLLEEERARRGISPAGALGFDASRRARSLVVGADLDQIVLRGGAISRVLRQN